MTQIQVIETDGKPSFYVVPAEMWDRISALLEDAEDAAAYQQAAAQDDGARIPMAVMKAELEGAHPVRAWREHRGLTLQALADAAKLSKPFVSQIEGRKRAGTTATLRKLAAALGVPLQVLLV